MGEEEEVVVHQRHRLVIDLSVAETGVSVEVKCHEAVDREEGNIITEECKEAEVVEVSKLIEVEEVKVKVVFVETEVASGDVVLVVIEVVVDLEGAAEVKGEVVGVKVRVQ